MADDDKRQYERDDWLGVSDIAELIARTPQRVRDMIEEFEIPHQRIGKRGIISIQYKDLDPIFERNTIPGKRKQDN